MLAEKINEAGVVSQCRKKKTMQKKKLSFEEHEDLGRELKDIHDRLQIASIVVSRGTRLSAKVNRTFDKALRHLVQLRCEMDGLAFRARIP
jgi:hypothetical protein